ncbi:MAG TPA: DUF1800 domain-containing protein [Pyrinomonadaceae bacterium]|nr:DUF1800 family protein [Acidobacteriota bacterium]HQZ95287.1 DUF1800 domain-containing protein [Pyrinomonadaceae bacterium]
MRFRSADGVFRFFLSLLIVFGFVIAPDAALAASVDRTALSADQRVVQVLSRLTFGARPGDVERVRKMGVEAFIAQQLDPDSIDDSALMKRLEKLPTLNLSTPVLAEQYNPPKPVQLAVGGGQLAGAGTPTPAQVAVGSGQSAVPQMVKPMEMQAAEMQPSPTPTVKPSPTPTPKNPQMVITELQRAKLLRAVYSERQLGEMVVDFWENHFSIYGNKDATRWMMTSFDRDVVRPFSFGRFRDLLGATAKSPAMLFYLDNWQSSLLKEYPATKDKPARKSGGINENYARELLELHTMGVDGGYTQKDVQEVARCFTGWSIRKPNEEGLFVYNPGNHDNGEKTVLGVKIPAGGGIGDGERVLDILAKNPKTAQFISTKLARRFLGDNPSPVVIDRAAKTFLATDGSIRETLRSIITSPQFFNTASFQTKVKSPFEFVASSLRITNAETDGQRPVLDWITKMGQPVYGRLTPDGYPDKSSEWLSSNDLLARFNFASALAMNTIKGTTVNTAKLITHDKTPLTRAGFARQMIIGTVSDKTLAAIEKLTVDLPPPTMVQTSAPAKPEPADAREKALNSQLVALALGAPEFQRK